MNPVALTLIGGAVLLEVIADIFFKYWAEAHDRSLIVAGLVLYTAGTVLWAYSLKYDYLSKAVTVFTVGNLLAVVIAGIFLFKEDVSVLQGIGIAFGVLSLILLQL